MNTFYKDIIVIFLFLVTFSSFAQTTSTNGTCNSWKTGTCWTNGAPTAGGTVTVNSGSNMILDPSSTTVAISGNYNFKGKVTDNGNGYSFDIKGNSGNLNIGSATNSNVTAYFAGTSSIVETKGTLHIYPGDTLIVGAPGTAATQKVLEWDNNSNIMIDAGGVLIVNGLLFNDNGSNKVTINGVITVNGNVNVSNGSSFDGSGSISASGSIGGGGKVFGTNSYSCTGPGCSSGCITNTITTSQTAVCAGSAPATIIGNSGTSYTYQWQSSITSASSGFSNISGATFANLTPSAPGVTTWYRRNVNLSTCSSPNSTSGAVKINVSTLPSVSVVGNSTICVGSTTTLSPTTGGTWSSSNTSVATVTNAGVVTGIAGGSATFTFTNSTAPNCFATTSSLLIKTLPSKPSSIIASVVSPCSTSVGITYTVNNVPGITYDWSFSGTGATITSSPANTNSITVSYVSATNGIWTVTPSNTCNGPSQTLAVNFNNHCSYVWNGSMDTDWANTLNWSGGNVPGAGNDVFISLGANKPLISGNAICRDITIDSGMTMTNNSGANLIIGGNIINKGIFTDNGTLTLNGSSVQSISGCATLNNLIINNPSGVTLSNAITIKGVLTLMQGTLNLNGKLLTVDLNTGAISGKGTGSIVGEIKVTKSVGTKWHHIGNPLGGTTVYFDQLADNTSIGNKNLYYYNESNVSTNMDIGWVPIAPGALASTNMVTMKGYNLYVDTRTTLDIKGDYNHNFSTTVPLSYTSSGNSLSDGWNLLSNPYPSTIDWEASSGWSKSGIDGAVYVYNKSQDKYMSYVKNSFTNSGSRYIGSMQGFWVKANSPGLISINNNVRVDSDVKPLLKEQSEMSSMKLSVSCNGYSDETVIRLASEGTLNFDPSIDAYKFKNFGNNPNISSQLNGVEYSINSISDTTIDEIIPLRLSTAFSGQYKLSVDLNEFISNSEVILIDKKSNIAQDLKFEPNYVFQTSTGDTDRFYIRLKQKAEVATGLTGENRSNVFMGSNGSVVTIRLNTGLSIANMSVINVLGNEVYKNDEVSVAGGLIKEQIEVASSGVYIVKLKIGEEIYTGRVYLK